MTRLMFLLTLVLGIHSAHAASEFNPLGLYLGGSVGRSDVKTQVGFSDFDRSNIGWKAFVGLRPLPLMAAELTHIDFGHPTVSTSAGAYHLHADFLQRAQALSGLIFAPIPLPLLGFYGRAGVARLQSSGNGYIRCIGQCLALVPNLAFNRTNTDFYYGAGVQVRLSEVAVRLEYERVNDDSRGDPDMLSIGLTLAF